MQSIKNNTKTIPGYFQSHKMGKSIKVRTLREYAFLYFLDFMSCVTSYEYEPFPFKYFMQGEFHEYTPDFRVETTIGSFIFEIKLVEYLENEREKLEFASEVIEAEGFKYRGITPDTIFKQPRYDNLHALHYYAPFEVEPDQYSRVISILESNDGTMPLKTLASESEPYGISFQTIYSLLFDQRIHFPITIDLVDNPHISMGGTYSFEDIFFEESQLSYHFSENENERFRIGRDKSSILELFVI